MKEFYENHSSEIIGGGLGLLLALSFVIWGFLATLLILIITLLGSIIGHYWPRISQIRITNNKSHE